MITNLIQTLSVELGLGSRDLLWIIATAPARYKVFEIPKRRGGTRTIAQPSRELKAIQRFVLENMLSELPVHSAATGYVAGRNIGQNARAHVNNRAVMKLDFSDFFPSIKVNDWERYARSAGIKFGPGELALYSRILFWGQRSKIPKCLSIGAPTSPILSNILLFELDTKLSDAAGKARVAYTRYADDITVSGARLEDLTRFEALARAVVQKMKSPQLMFNEEKRGVYTMGQRRMVTGLVLTPTQKISIGRQRKRLISVMLHKVATSSSTAEIMATLKGLLGFCLAVEPDFVSRMRIKYGNASVDGVLRYQIPRTGPPLRAQP
jgi:RNA-directed DNA polymerase